MTVAWLKVAEARSWDFFLLLFHAVCSREMWPYGPCRARRQVAVIFGIPALRYK
jgi:hypothetical protein